MNKTETIRALVAADRAVDVRELVLGISRFCISEIASSPRSEVEEELRQMAEVHLSFIENYGTKALHVQEGPRHRFAYPQEFEAWLAAGAPGVEDADVEAYLSANPIPEGHGSDTDAELNR